MGLHHAGFDVVGIDVERQPRYPFDFIQADATCPPVVLDDFDFIWASPPCQHYSISSAHQRQQGKEYPDLVEPVRAMLATTRALTAIENVIGAPLRRDLVLDGTMFPPPARSAAAGLRAEFLLPVPAFGNRQGSGSAPWVRVRRGRWSVLRRAEGCKCVALGTRKAVGHGH